VTEKVDSLRFADAFLIVLGAQGIFHTGVVTDAQQIESCVRSCFPKLQSLTTGYMLLYDDQGVSLVYGSSSYVQRRKGGRDKGSDFGTILQLDSTNRISIPTVLVHQSNPAQTKVTRGSNKISYWMLLVLTCSLLIGGFDLSCLIHIQQTEAKASCMHTATTLQVLQPMRMMPARPLRDAQGRPPGQCMGPEDSKVSKPQRSQSMIEFRTQT